MPPWRKRKRPPTQSPVVLGQQQAAQIRVEEAAPGIDEAGPGLELHAHHIGALVEQLGEGGHARRVVRLAHADAGSLGRSDALARGLGERAQQHLIVESGLEVAAHDVDRGLEVVGELEAGAVHGARRSRDRPGARGRGRACGRRPLGPTPRAPRPEQRRPRASRARVPGHGGRRPPIRAGPAERRSSTSATRSSSKVRKCGS